ncbi:hypothetical protein Xoosp14_246 [Xanthomonas phage Xoo-sp14]|nr:hypothetical protein Xoosp14_246 [Xanthomonas phage Xoo-sp14]
MIKNVLAVIGAAVVLKHAVKVGIKLSKDYAELEGYRRVK